METDNRRSWGIRPQPERQRSNSLPIVEALGCSTAEAKLIIAEGQAAVRSRNPHARRRPRSLHRPDGDLPITTFRPEDHLHHLDPTHTESNDQGQEDTEAPEAAAARTQRPFHVRVPSNHTDNSTSTITGPARSPELFTMPPQRSASNPLESYSAGLARFVQSQLSAIPTYNTSARPLSPGVISNPPKSPPIPQSPKAIKRSVDMPPMIEMPPVRPPLRSAFSEWSSTDDETDVEISDNEEDLPPLPVLEVPRRDSITGQYTPSILGYYERSGRSFLNSSSPEEPTHPHAKDFQFPPQSVIPKSVPQQDVPATSSDQDAASLSNVPAMTSSSIQSSSSGISYFSSKSFIKKIPLFRHKATDEVTPMEDLSPLKDADHVRAPAVGPVSKRIMVEGMSFDLLRTGESVGRVPAPC